MGNRNAPYGEGRNGNRTGGRQLAQVRRYCGIRDEQLRCPQHLDRAPAAVDRYVRMNLMRKTVMVEVRVRQNQSRDFRTRIRIQSVDVWQHSFAAQLLARASHGPARPIATVWPGEWHSDIQQDSCAAVGPPF